MNTLPITIEPLEDRIAPAAIVVTNLNDSGSGSLRQAIIDANNTSTHPGVDVITFAPAVHGTIHLTTGEMLISDKLAIIGPGPGKLIIDAGNASRIFRITDGNSNTDSIAAMAGLSLIDGNVTNVASSDGGAIFSQESLALINCAIAGNKANFGGGVAVLGGTNSSVKIIHSTFTNNVSTAQNGFGEGGGLALEADKTVSITGSRVLNNTSDYGGGLLAEVATINGASNITISGCVIAGNSATKNGGGLEVSNNSTGGTAPIHIIGSVIANNFAANSAGGVLAEEGDCMLQGTVISGNIANNQGGGLFGQGFNSLAFISSKISGNRTTANSSTASGGGVYLRGSHTATFNATAITGNSSTAGSGGGIFAENGVDITLNNSLLDGNRAAGNGGGMDVAGPFVTLNGGVVSNNFALNDGGGIYSTANGTLKITGTKLVNNICDAGGGAVFSSGPVSFQLVNAILAGNSASNEGGAIFAAQGALTITGGTIAGNNTGSLGGGIFIAGAVGGTSINGATIVNNIAGSTGGGIYQSTGGGVTVGAGTVVTGNTAPTDPDRHNI